MKINLGAYLIFLEEAKRCAIPSNFLTEGNYTIYIRACNGSIDVIRPIMDEVTLSDIQTMVRDMETEEYYRTLEDDDYYTNLLENASI